MRLCFRLFRPIISLNRSFSHQQLASRILQPDLTYHRPRIGYLLVAPPNNADLLMRSPPHFVQRTKIAAKDTVAGWGGFSIGAFVEKCSAEMQVRLLRRYSGAFVKGRGESWLY